MHEIYLFYYLRVICTCDQCDSPFCALQLTALIKPNCCVLQYCCACLCHRLIVVQPSWTTVRCPKTKLGLLISIPFAGMKHSVISVALRTPLQTRLLQTSLRHRPDNYIGFTSSFPPTFYNKIAPVCSSNLVFANETNINMSANLFLLESIWLNSTHSQYWNLI